jgi:hypothetical protein
MKNFFEAHSRNDISTCWITRNPLIPACWGPFDEMNFIRTPCTRCGCINRLTKTTDTRPRTWTAKVSKMLLDGALIDIEHFRVAENVSIRYLS